MGRSVHTGTVGGAGDLGSLNIVDNILTTRETDQHLDLDPNGEGSVRVVNDISAGSTSTGSLVVTGGVGIGENLWVGGDIEGAGTINGGTF